MLFGSSSTAFSIGERPTPKVNLHKPIPIVGGSEQLSRNTSPFKIQNDSPSYKEPAKVEEEEKEEQICESQPNPTLLDEKEV